MLKGFVDGNFERHFYTLVAALHRNRKAAGSIPARGSTVAVFATAPAWLTIISVFGSLNTAKSKKVVFQ